MKNKMVICDHAEECKNVSRKQYEARCWHEQAHISSHENEGYGSGLDCDKEFLECNVLKKKVKCEKYEKD